MSCVERMALSLIVLRQNKTLVGKLAFLLRLSHNPKSLCIRKAAESHRSSPFCKVHEFLGEFSERKALNLTPASLFLQLTPPDTARRL